MDPVCRGGSNRHLAGDLDVEIIWHQRFINQPSWWITRSGTAGLRAPGRRWKKDHPA